MLSSQEEQYFASTSRCSTTIENGSRLQVGAPKEIELIVPPAENLMISILVRFIKMPQERLTL